MTIRAATPADATAIAEIYRPYVEGTAITFELDPPGPEEMARRMAEYPLPWLVLERDDAVAGYAYARPFHTRAAYRWVVESSIYLRQDLTGKRLGGPLYEALIDALEDAGFVAAIATITLPNRASVRLHETLGFEPAGTHARVGYKLGRWHDVGRWQLDIAPRRSVPAEPSYSR